ncbi:MAG: hypothetical protein KIT16_20735 [Rhodospirillaceae bacterium]|nr:hypothetical protein [Rhodospirillaceae bacterium]
MRNALHQCGEARIALGSILGRTPLRRRDAHRLPYTPLDQPGIGGTRQTRVSPLAPPPSGDFRGRYRPVELQVAREKNAGTAHVEPHDRNAIKGKISYNKAQK